MCTEMISTQQTLLKNEMNYLSKLMSVRASITQIN